MNHTGIEQELRTFLSEREIITDTGQLLTDRRGRYTGRAAAVLMPDSVEKIQAVVRWCAERRISITPQGGNTGLCGAAVPDGGILLNLSRLNRIRSISLADHAVTVEAGAILYDVQQAAERVGRLFPLSLASEGSCQIGGNIACNAGGLNVLRYGTMRNLVLGLEVVLPDGSLLSHLAPLHKNTTGYDLCQLFVGSEGTLGVITAATLKLFARPKTTVTAWIGADDIGAAVQLLTRIQGHFAERLCSFELMSRFALELSSGHSGLSAPLDAAWHILLELHDSLLLPELADDLAEFLFEAGWHNAVLAQSEGERETLWRLREDISAAQKALGASIKHDIAVPIERVAELVGNTTEELKQAYPGMEIVVFGHLGDGSLHFNTFLPHVRNNEVYAYEDGINRIVYRNTLACCGTIAAEHGIGQVKSHWLPKVRSGVEIDLMHVIKARLDPHNLFNPGKLLPPQAT